MNKLDQAKFFIDEILKDRNYEIKDVKGKDEFVFEEPIKCAKILSPRKMERKLTIEISYIQTLGTEKELTAEELFK